MAERTLVAAGSNLLARGFLVVPTDRRSRAGQPVNGLFAVARAILRVVAFKVPARAVAVVDASPNPAWPGPLAAQHRELPSLLSELGLVVVEAEESASLVASYAQAALAADDDVIIAAVDKRFAQLVGERLWWYDANKDARYTTEIVKKRFNVPPEQVAEWLGLVGDEDQLPGVAGIGAKGATTLLTTYGSIEAALASIDEIKGRLGNALRAAREDVPRELSRARLDRHLPLPVPLGELAYAPAATSDLNALFDRLGFVELLAADGAGVQVVACETEDEVLRALETLGPGPITIHALLENPAPVRQALAGIALAGAGEGGFYVPFEGAGWSVLRAWLEAPAAPKMGHDLVATMVALRRAGIRLAGIVGDSACASHLSNPSNWAPHDLGTVAKHVLGRALAGEETVRGVEKKRKAWADLPIERAAAFAGTAAAAAAAVWNALSPTVDRALLDEYLELSDTLVRMELTGLIVDPAELERTEVAFAEIEAELAQEIESLAGHSFNFNSTKQLGTVLYEELGLPIASRTKTGWSTSMEALERIEHAHPLVPLVIRWRRLRRLRDSWLIALRRFIDDDGRVHSRFHLARSFSGHLINTSPDLGRVPGRTPEMARIRRAFVAAPGRLLMSVDFNQLGLYVLAHLSKDPSLIEPLTRREDLHTLTAAAVLDKPAETITIDERQIGKVVNFATFAGQGSSALALQLGISAQDAKAMIERFDRRYSAVRAFQEEQLRLARARGWVETVSGRRWPIGGLESLDPHDRSYAERLARRASHEGSVADVSRRALLEADRALRREGLGTVPVLQVLDEVLFDVPEAELAAAAKLTAEAMRHAFELEVPLVVGVEAGPNWADLEPIPDRS